MNLSAFLLIVLLIGTGMLHQARSMQTVVGLYGETTVVPCDDRTPLWDKLILTMWTFVQDDGTPVVLIKHFDKAASAPATDSYDATRVSIDDRSGLTIGQSALTDRRVYTCVVVSQHNVRVRRISVVVYTTVQPEIVDKAELLEKDKLTTLGTCVVRDAHPAAEITWQKNGLPLRAYGKRIVVVSTVKIDSTTGLSTTSSSLQYTATREDVDARFNCRADHELGPVESDETLTFPVHYPTERVSLTVTPEGPIAEGDTVTLKCHGDGNPAPSSYNFHLKGQKVLVENLDTYTLPTIERDGSGEYKCSLVDNEKMEASRYIAVSYLDLSLSPTGKVLKMVRDPLVVKLEMDASGDAQVIWTKDGEKTEAPLFRKLTYAHAGLYVCEVSVALWTRHRSFELVVEGAPVITSLTQDDVQLTCQAEGVPEPQFTWNVNGTNEEISYNEKTGKATNKITVEPAVNLTSVTCSVSNRLGEDAKTVSVSWSSDDSGDQGLLIVVGIVVGIVLGLFAILVGFLIRGTCCKTDEENNFPVV